VATDNALLDSIRHGLTQTLGEAVKLQWLRDLPGGDINRAALLRSGDGDFFLKYHHNAPGDMFATEALALKEILELDCLRVPKPIALGQHAQTSWLVIEYLELTASGPPALLGEQLAAMHNKGHDFYGWHCNNYIGSTPQFNGQSDNWTIFWREKNFWPAWNNSLMVTSLEHPCCTEIYGQATRHSQPRDKRLFSTPPVTMVTGKPISQ
jgi:fructosamine-3-kinase